MMLKMVFREMNLIPIVPIRQMEGNYFLGALMVTPVFFLIILRITRWNRWLQLPILKLVEYHNLDTFLNLPSFLNYNQNSFAFEFAALEYTNPKKNQYLYMLEGFEDDWIYSGTRRSATYTNIDPGDYIFKVKGSNNDDVWSSVDAHIVIEILPPFWGTSWAYAFYILTFIVLIYSVVKWRAGRLEKDKQVLEHKVQEKVEELNESYERLRQSQQELLRSGKLKSIGTLASGIAHNFNNLLAIILNSAELLHKKDVSKDADKYLKRIEQAATDGAEIIKKIQNFGRGEDTPSKTAVDLNEVLADVIEISRFKWLDQKQKQGLNIEIRPKFEKIPPVEGNESELRVALIDVFINAIDAHKKSGAITISTWLNNEQLVSISIKDEGIGSTVRHWTIFLIHFIPRRVCMVTDLD